MAELPSDFWFGWIAIITATSLVGLTWVIFSVYFSPKSETGEKSPVWDETLSEGANAPPLWWFWLILSLLVFSVVYLILYPGLGSAAGVMRWSQGGHLEHSAMMYGDEFDAARSRIASTPIEMLQADPAAMASAERVFRNNCAACHGANAQGQAALFPNLRDGDWQWGGGPEAIEQSIRNGRQAVMPAHGMVVGAEGVAQLVRYVTALSAGGRVVEAGEGRMLFQTYCLGCHDEDGSGTQALGAPNLTDGIWLYGGSDEALANTITNGRNGVMPPFEARLDDTQIRLLVAWLRRGA